MMIVHRHSDKIIESKINTRERQMLDKTKDALNDSVEVNMI